MHKWNALFINYKFISMETVSCACNGAHLHILYEFNRMTDRELVMMVIDKTKCIWLIHHINREYNPFKTISMTFLVPITHSALMLTAQSFDRVNTFDGAIFETLVFLFAFEKCRSTDIEWKGIVDNGKICL